MIVIEMARTMMKDYSLANAYWKEVAHTIVYILNGVQIRVNHTKTPYGLWNRIPSTIKYFRIFESNCYIRRDENDLGKFDTKTDERILLGYSTNNKAYRCYNKRLVKIVESVNVKVCETWDQTASKPIQETKIEIILIVAEEKANLEDNNEKETYEIEEEEEELEQAIKTPKYVQRNHLEDQIIRGKNKRVQTRSVTEVNEQKNYYFLSLIIPKSYEEANKEESWVKTMEEELNQIQKNQT